MSKYDEVLKPFVSLMERELHANSGKGDRPGWLSMSAYDCMLEIYYHAAKLQKAIKNGDGIAEYSADVANMAMMVADICGAIHLAAQVVDVAEWDGPYGEGHGKAAPVVERQEPVAYLIRGVEGVKMLAHADGIPVEKAKAAGWRPLYDHLTDGETETVRVANAIAKDWEKRYRRLEKAGYETDRMVDELREQLDAKRQDNCHVVDGVTHYHFDGHDGLFVEAVDFHADRPAPIAVVLPDRMPEVRAGTGRMIAYGEGWNACLDKVKEMNGVKP